MRIRATHATLPNHRHGLVAIFIITPTSLSFVRLWYCLLHIGGIKNFELECQFIS